MSLERPFLGEDYEAKKQEREEEMELNSYIHLKRIISAINPENYDTEQKRLMAETLKSEDLPELMQYIADYVKTADEEEFFAHNEGKEISVESKDKQERLDAARIATHNMLMDSMNLIYTKLSKLNLDNTFIRAIIHGDRKIDRKFESDRRAVERWARLVAKYLATIAETTKEG